MSSHCCHHPVLPSSNNVTRQSMVVSTHTYQSSVHTLCLKSLQQLLCRVTLRAAGLGGYSGPAGTSGCIGRRSFALDCWAPATTGMLAACELSVLPVPSATAIAILKTPHTPTAAIATAPKAAGEIGKSDVLLISCQRCHASTQYCS